MVETYLYQSEKTQAFIGNFSDPTEAMNCLRTGNAPPGVLLHVRTGEDSKEGEQVTVEKASVSTAS